MDVNVCIERSVIRAAYTAATENMPHEAAVSEVARAYGLADEVVEGVVAQEAAAA